MEDQIEGRTKLMEDQTDGGPKNEFWFNRGFAPSRNPSARTLSWWEDQTDWGSNWWRIKLMEDQTDGIEDQIDGGPIWWTTKLMEDHIDGGPNLWEDQTGGGLEDHTDGGPNWWRIKLMDDQIDGRTKLMGGPNWLRVKLMEDQLNPLNGTYIYLGCFRPVISLTPYI